MFPSVKLKRYSIAPCVFPGGGGGGGGGGLLGVM